MGKGMSFSARYELQPSPHDELNIFSATTFLLKGIDVMSNINTSRPFDYFHGVVDDKGLLLFYLGAEYPPKTMPTQGHYYEKTLAQGFE